MGRVAPSCRAASKASQRRQCGVVGEASALHPGSQHAPRTLSQRSVPSVQSDRMEETMSGVPLKNLLPLLAVPPASTLLSTAPAILCSASSAWSPPWLLVVTRPAIVCVGQGLAELASAFHMECHPRRLRLLLLLLSGSPLSSLCSCCCNGPVAPAC